MNKFIPFTVELGLSSCTTVPQQTLVIFVPPAFKAAGEPVHDAVSRLPTFGTRGDTRLIREILRAGLGEMDETDEKRK